MEKAMSAQSKPFTQISRELSEIFGLDDSISCGLAEDENARLRRELAGALGRLEGSRANLKLVRQGQDVARIVIERLESDLREARIENNLLREELARSKRETPSADSRSVEGAKHEQSERRIP
jgi:hypothetical protein